MPFRPADPSPRSHGTLSFVVVAALCLFAWVVGIRGIDYGEHWDEWYAQEGTENAVKNLQLFPGDFTYNGVYFDLAAVPVFADVVRSFPAVFPQIAKAPTRPMDAARYPAIKEMQDKTLAYVKSNRYLLDTRALFLFFSSFIIVGLALAARCLWPERVVVVVVAAATAALSYEVGYHARYIAVDSLMGALTALMLASMAWARTTRSPSSAQLAWVLAAMCGGLAFGCKVTGVAYCIPIGIGAFFSPAGYVPRWRDGWLLRLRRVALVAVVFVVAYLFTTPGFVRDPVRFAAGVFHTSATYARGKFAYAVDGLLDHTVKFFSWLFVDVPSPFWPFSLLLVFFGGVGARRLWRRDRELSIALCCFVALYGFIVLKAGQMVVRNALPLVPVLVLCIAAGVDITLAGVNARLRAALSALLVAGFVANAGYSVWAGETVRTVTQKTILRDTAAWLNKNADRPLWVSPNLHKNLKQQLAQSYNCAKTNAAPPQNARAALFFLDHPRKRWKANGWHLYEKHFSSQETNLTYYANWRAKNYKARTVVMPASTLQVNAIRTRGWFACTPK